MKLHLYRKVKKLAEEKDNEALVDLVSKEDFHETAQIINISGKKKAWIFSILPVELQSIVIFALTENAKKEIFPTLTQSELAGLLRFLDNDDATDIIQFLPKNRQPELLETLQEEKRKKIEQLLQFDPDSAGGLMDLDFIIIKDIFTFKDVAAKLESHIEKEQSIPYIILMTEEGKIRGYIPHNKLILSAPDTPVAQLSQNIPTLKHSVKPRTILKRIKNTKSQLVGVVDDKEQFIGIIHIEDILRLVHHQATIDVFRFAGLRGEEAINDSIFLKVKRRYMWLIINLGTAFLAASVVGLFENTIARLALLAVYMPVVAGEGGNAATQALAVVTRGLATDEIGWSQAKKIIFKESIAGALNGIIIGTLSSIIAFLTNAPPMLGVVIGISMVANLFIAGFFGALIPFILKSMRVDPAVASSIFVTTATDIIGFFVFLGLGTILLL